MTSAAACSASANVEGENLVAVWDVEGVERSCRPIDKHEIVGSVESQDHEPVVCREPDGGDRGGR